MVLIADSGQQYGRYQLYREQSLHFYSANTFTIIGVGLFTFLTIMMLSVFQRAKQLLVYLVNRNSRCKYKSANMRFASFLHQCYQHFFNSTYQHVKSLIFRLYFYDLFITIDRYQQISSLTIWGFTATICFPKKISPDKTLWFIRTIHI